MTLTHHIVTMDLSNFQNLNQLVMTLINQLNLGWHYENYLAKCYYPIILIIKPVPIQSLMIYINWDIIYIMQKPVSMRINWQIGTPINLSFTNITSNIHKSITSTHIEDYIDKKNKNLDSLETRNTNSILIYD